MKNYINSLRVAPENWIIEERFQTLLALLKKHPCNIGQVALFVYKTHSPILLSELEEQARIAEKRFVTLREAGFSAGYNLLTTIGHHNESIENSHQSDAYRMTNIHGQICQGCYCIRDLRHWEGYVKPAYTILANTNPDFIWIDDDVRYGHMPVGNGCFCDGCMKAFNDTYGHSFTRETLRIALNDENYALRHQWLEHNGRAMIGLLGFIGKTVRSVSDSIILGFMTGERYFESFNFKGFADALSENGKYQIMWRPGAGTYTDFSMESFIDKVRSLGRQTARLPEYVTAIQSEIENFPYQLIKKSPLYTAMEGLLYMSSGCTGAAFNILPSESLEPIENCEAHLRAINSVADNYAMLHKYLYGKKPVGIGSGWRPDAMVYTAGPEWTNTWPQCGQYTQELFCFGLPECFGDTHVVCTTMNKETASMLSDEQVIQVLSGGVYMDAEALTYLNERGFGEYTGFTVDKEVPIDAMERYTDAPLNGAIAGGIRNCRQAFNPGPSFALKSTAEGTVTLCELVDYTGACVGECALGLYENSLGGRVAVAGYYPYTWVSDYNKSRQLTALFRYLSKNTLPAYIDSYCRLYATAFENKANARCITVFNANPDVQTDIAFVALTEKTQCKLHVGAETITLDGTAQTGGYARFVIPTIAPFQIVLIEL